MMYNSNKKVGNKYAIIFVSFLLFISSLLAFNPSWLNKFYGETLCASSTYSVVTEDDFNFKSSTFIDGVDFVNYYFNPTGYSSSDSILVPCYALDSSIYSSMPTSSTAGKFTSSNGFTNYSLGYYSMPNYNTSYNPTFYSNGMTYISGGNSYLYFVDSADPNIDYLYIYFDLQSSASILTSGMSTNDFVFKFERNGTTYKVISNSLYQKYLTYLETSNAYSDGYDDGYTAGQTDGYNSGYTAGNNAGVTTGQNNVINNPNDYDLYTQSQYESNYTNGYNAGYSAGIIQGQNNVINNPSQFGLYTQSQYDLNYTNGYNDGINNVVSNPSQYNLYTQSQYEQNYQNGVESTTNYQDGLANGITQGQNNVINNPSQFGLYTQTQYEENYNNGYNDGVNYATNLYDGYGNFLYSKFYWTSFADKYTHLVYDGVDSSNYVLSGVFSNYLNYFDKFVGGFTLNSSYVSMIQDLDGRFADGEGLNLDRSIMWFEFDNFVSISQFPNIVTPNAIRLGSIYYVELSDGTMLEYNGADTVFDGISLSNYDNLYIVRIGMGFTNVQDYMSSLNGMAFNTRDSLEYQLGYNDGNKYGFDKGKKDGYNVGYAEGRSDGINSADGNTFTSLIMAVVDAPINMFKSLFNFDILGFNLLGFATGVFTLCVFIFIIKKFIGK